MIFLQHMLPVLQHVRDKGFTPILWDDMMREWTIDFLKGLLSLLLNFSMNKMQKVVYYGTINIGFALVLISKYYVLTNM